MPAVALTDHGVLHAGIEFYQEAQSYGIKPILGCEVYFTETPLSERNPDAPITHFTLLAKDETGYLNLVKLLSISHLEGFYKKPRLNWEVLAEHHKGIILLTGCEQSLFSRWIQAGDEPKAKNVLAKLYEIFGEDLYVEIQYHRREIEEKMNEVKIRLARQFGLPVVATNDVHYLNKSDAFIQDVVLCIQTKKVLTDTDRMKMEPAEYYFKTPQEMQELFSEVPEAIKNTLAVAERCQEYLNFREMKPRFPAFQPPPGFSSPEAYFEHLCREGFQARYPEQTKEALKRLEHEMRVIEDKGFTTYFLVVQDFIRFAKEQDIPVGPGRGSATGSLVAYCLGITDVDPLKYNLLFERFLNPERKSLPDIDIDFCARRRDEVIGYVRKRYGEEHTAQIVTFGRMMSRAAVRDVGRVMGLDLPLVDSVARMIPFGARLPQVLKSPEVRALFKKSPEVRALLTTAVRVEGLVRNTSVHAGGIVVGDVPLSSIVPLKFAKEGEIITQYPMEALEEVGLVKMDFLGLRNLTLIQKCLQLLKETRNITVDLKSIPLNNAKTYELFQNGATEGIFQFEKEGAKRLCREVKPKTLLELTAINAMNRPGPLQSGMADTYIRRKQKKEPVTYLHPDLEPILKETFGVILYQEQLLQIAEALAGFSPGEADDLRKAVGKKDPELMERTLKKFLAGCEKRSIPPPIAKKILDTMAEFAQYGFNKSHSAAYALVAYQTAYLKAHYPVEFMTALLSSVIGNLEKTAEYIAEARRLGIPVYPPDINKSEAFYKVEGHGIRTGLCTIKGVGESAVENLVKQRTEGGDFIHLLDFCQRVDTRLINKGVIESLIKAGSFDRLHAQRPWLLDQLSDILTEAQVRRERAASGMQSLFTDASVQEPEPGLLFPSNLLERFDPSIQWMMEREVLGFFLSGHPLEAFRGVVHPHPVMEIARLKQSNEERSCRIFGFISDFSVKISRRGNRYAKGVLEDLTGRVDFQVFSRVLESAPPDFRISGMVYMEGRLQREEAEEGMEMSEEEETLRTLFLVERILPPPAIPSAGLTPESPLSTLPSFSLPVTPLVITLKAKEVTEESLQKLRTLLKKYPGEHPVRLEIQEVPGESSPISIILAKEFSVLLTPTLYMDLQSAGFREVYRAPYTGSSPN